MKSCSATSSRSSVEHGVRAPLCLQRLAFRGDDRLLARGARGRANHGVRNRAGRAGGSSTKGDAGAQATRCLAIIVAAIEELGGSAKDVVRTRMYLTDAADAEAIGDAHGAVFGDIRPASTMVVVAALLRPEWRVEIEAEAVLASTLSDR